MTLRTLILRSLRFHWRGHLGVLLGAAIGSAALIGALVVGDSVRVSLRELALQRLGNVHFVMDTGDRLFRAGLADMMLASIPQRAGSRESLIFYSGTSTIMTQVVANRVSSNRVVLSTNRFAIPQAGPAMPQPRAGAAFASGFLPLPGMTNNLITIAPVLRLAATATVPDGDRRANRIQLLG